MQALRHQIKFIANRFAKKKIKKNHECRDVNRRKNKKL